jgi:hypothetical protein
MRDRFGSGHKTDKPIGKRKIRRVITNAMMAQSAKMRPRIFLISFKTF